MKIKFVEAKRRSGQYIRVNGKPTGILVSEKTYKNNPDFCEEINAVIKAYVEENKAPVQRFYSKVNKKFLEQVGEKEVIEILMDGVVACVKEESAQLKVHIISHEFQKTLDFDMYGPILTVPVIVRYVVIFVQS
jgi:hypothetical protein